MHAVLLTLGSHGDVHPFLGIGMELRRRGHRVTLVTNAHFSPLAASHGLEFVPVGTQDDYDRLTRDPDLWKGQKGGFVVMEVMSRSLREAYAAVRDLACAETVVAASTLGVAAQVAAEAHGTKTVSIHLSPFVFRSEIDPPRLPGVPPLGWMPAWMLRRFFYGADKWVLDPRVAPPVNALRAELGLTEPVRNIMKKYWHSPTKVLGMWPDWFAPDPGDWPGHAELCGFGLYDEAMTAEVPAELEAFLRAGKPPVAFTPGSAMRDGRRFFEAAAEACRLTGLRGVLLTRFDGQIPATLPAGVIHTRYAPFGKLLPRCRAVVHHGGIGTLSQALRAGIAQLVMPMAHDQFDNATRLRRLGVGGSLPVRKFTSRRLAAALTELLSGPAPGRSAEARIRLAGQDGLANAATTLERVADGSRDG